jgi:hypothetical protein
MDHWSKNKNPETGSAFEHFPNYIECTHNGKADASALLSTGWRKY